MPDGTIRAMILSSDNLSKRYPVKYKTIDDLIKSIRDAVEKRNTLYAKGGGDKKRSLMSMANLVVDDWKGEKIRDWYTKNYPTDELGKEINDITFEDLWNAINFDNIYDVIGVGDSLIRERLFEHLSEIYGLVIITFTINYLELKDTKKALLLKVGNLIEIKMGVYTIEGHQIVGMVGVKIHIGI